MEILEAYDATGCAHSAAQLVGCDAKTVRRYVALREAGGGDPLARAGARRPKLIDAFLPKVEELVDGSKARIRADKVHERLVAMGFAGTERTTRRAVRAAKLAWRAGRRRSYRPWVPEPGLWLQFDWGEGPRVDGRRTWLFCAWLAWSRFRVVIPVWDQTMGSLIACVDATLRRIGGAPAYLLGDNAKTVTVEHVAGVAVRHPMVVAAGRHYGCTVYSCEPFDPESKGGVEATVRIAKADLVPTETNLRGAYGSFTELVAACQAWGEHINARVHRETGAAPVDRLALERARLHPLPVAPHVVALGEERLVNEDQTVRFGSVRYSTPPGHVDTRVWCRVVGEELVIVAMTSTGTWRLPGIGCPRRVTRASATSTTRTIPAATTRARRGRGPARRPRPTSWPSARARTRGWSRPPRPGPPGCGRRWPGRSSSPPSWAPTGSTTRWAWPPRPAGSTNTTSARSSTTWPPTAPPAN
jgi:transposase